MAATDDHSGATSCAATPATAAAASAAAASVAWLQVSFKREFLSFFLAKPFEQPSQLCGSSGEVHRLTTFGQSQCTWQRGTATQSRHLTPLDASPVAAESHR